MKNKLLIGLTLTVCLLMLGCQVNDAVNVASNSNTTANINTNSNANAVQTFKNDLVGSWIAVDDPKAKIIFTADEMTLVENGQENKVKYTRLSDDEIEFILEGKKTNAKTTFEGEVLTITSNKTAKFKRESVSENNNANELKTTEILFDETTFEFGSISEGEIFTHEYKFKNSGTSPLVVKEGASSCNCVTVDFAKEPIPPGGMSKITVRFDSKTKAGKRNQKVWITANTNPPQSYLYLTGEVMGR